MYIRETLTRRTANKTYRSVRLVESRRVGSKVQQKTLLNLCGKACKDDPLGGKSASSLTHLVWLQKLLFVVQRWKGKRG